MMRYLFALMLIIGCRPPVPEEIPWPTRICVRTLHHFQPVPHTTVYIKLNTDSFPGYDQPVSYYDLSFKTGADAKGCIEDVPPGKHWLVAFGYDSLYWPHHVYGSLPIRLDLDSKPVIDTLLYVSE